MALCANPVVTRDEKTVCAYPTRQRTEHFAILKSPKFKKTIVSLGHRNTHGTPELISQVPHM